MALQYWEQVKESYDSIEVEDLNARELEIIKPILAIAAIISDDIYNDMMIDVRGDDIIPSDYYQSDVSQDFDTGRYYETKRKKK